MPKVNLLERIKYSFAGNQLSSIFYRFLRVHASFMVFTTLPSVFINTYLMGQTNNFNVVLLYNAMVYLFSAFGMFFSAAVIHRFSSGAVSLVGIIGYNLLYLQLILYGEKAPDFAVLLGITAGLAGSFYWMSYSNLVTEYTDLQNRDSGLAVINITVSFINLLVPLISGILISLVGGINGYYTVFGLAFVIAVITAVGVIRLPKASCALGAVHYGDTFSHVWKHKCLLYGILAQGAMGMREGVFSFILNIILYSMIKNEALVGFNTFLSGGAAIASFMVINRIVRVHNRMKFMRIAVAALFAYSLCTIFTLNPVVVLLFTAVNSLFAGFITNSCFVSFLDAVQVVPSSGEKRPELFAMKELALAIGRCIGILVNRYTYSW